MTKISDERLAELISNASGTTEEAWWLDDVADALTELQSIRSKPVGVEVKGDVLFTTIQDAYLHGMDWGRKYGSTEAEEIKASYDYADKTTAALSALSLLEQEPVTYQLRCQSGQHVHFEECAATVDGAMPVYASPQPKAGITEEMVERAARAMDPFAFRDNSVATDEWHELEVEGRAQALGRARAALEAALKGA